MGIGDVGDRIGCRSKSGRTRSEISSRFRIVVPEVIVVQAALGVVAVVGIVAMIIGGPILGAMDAFSWYGAPAEARRCRMPHGGVLSASRGP